MPTISDNQGHILELGGNDAIPTKLVGSLSSAAHTTATVGVSTGLVLAANVNRKYALIANDSDTTVYLKLGVNAVLKQGIPVVSGGNYEMSSAMGNLYTGDINGICSLAGRLVLVTEGV